LPIGKSINFLRMSSLFGAKCNDAARARCPEPRATRRQASPRSPRSCRRVATSAAGGATARSPQRAPPTLRHNNEAPPRWSAPTAAPRARKTEPRETRRQAQPRGVSSRWVLASARKRAPDSPANARLQRCEIWWCAWHSAFPEPSALQLKAVTVPFAVDIPRFRHKHFHRRRRPGIHRDRRQCQ
jgi:hypothetical protein